MSETFSVWFLIGAALVFWMQAGFAMVEAGFTRSKNTGNIIMKNLMDFCIGTCTFILIGFSLLLGEDLLGSVQQQPLLYQGQWQKEQNSYLIVFIQALFPPLFIQLKRIGFGVVDGYHNLVSMILQDHVQSIWLVVSPH